MVILPRDNKPDYDELPKYLKEKIRVHFVHCYDDVLKIAFPRSKR